MKKDIWSHQHRPSCINYFFITIYSTYTDTLYTMYLMQGLFANHIDVCMCIVTVLLTEHACVMVFLFCMYASIHVHTRLMMLNLSFRALMYTLDVCTIVCRCTGAFQECTCQIWIVCILAHANCKPRTVL